MPLSLEPMLNRESLDPVPFNQIPMDFDTAVPVLVLKLSRNAIQHGTVGIVRSLGRRGVPVFACVEDRFAPAAVCRYLKHAFVWQNRAPNPQPVLMQLAAIADRLGRRAILLPTDDAGAAFVAEHSAALEKWFLFPRLAKALPRRLANKRELHALCKSIGVPCPEAAFPASAHDVHEFIERGRFPVVLKAAEPQRLPKGARGVSIARTPPELLALYRKSESPDGPNLILQEYIPDACAEDWIFHGYVNPHTDCLVGFTGRKFRSHPAFAGSTTLGVSVRNEALLRQTEKLLRAVSYAGIMDIDYRLDKRDGLYKLLDFNPRVGANFRMFEDGAGIDVVRALHLDLTGRRVPRLPVVEGRTFIVEPYDLFASLRYMLRGRLTVGAWWRSLKGSPREIAWFTWDDPMPFLTMCVRLLLRAVAHAVRKGGEWVSPRLSRQESEDTPREAGEPCGPGLIG